MQDKEYETEIDLFELYEILKKGAIFIIATTAIVTIAVFGYFKMQVHTPEYQSTSLVRVECPEHQKLNNLLNEKNLNQALIMQATSEVIRREVSYSTLINTYSEIIKSQAVMKKANELANVTFNQKIGTSMLDIKKVNDSQIMSITVKNADPALAQAFDDMVLGSFVTYMNNQYGDDNTGITVIEPAQVATIIPVKSRAKTYTMLAFAASLVGSIMLVVGKHLLKEEYEQRKSKKEKE